MLLEIKKKKKEDLESFSFDFFFVFHPWLPTSQLSGVLVQLRALNTFVERKNRRKKIMCDSGISSV